MAFSVTVTEIREDGSEIPVDGELAAALAGPAGQFSSMLAWSEETKTLTRPRKSRSMRSLRKIAKSLSSVVWLMKTCAGMDSILQR